jgi:hypothetical protein
VERIITATPERLIGTRTGLVGQPDDIVVMDAADGTILEAIPSTGFARFDAEPETGIFYALTPTGGVVALAHESVAREAMKKLNTAVVVRRGASFVRPFATPAETLRSLWIASLGGDEEAWLDCLTYPSRQAVAELPAGQRPPLNPTGRISDFDIVATEIDGLEATVTVESIIDDSPRSDTVPLVRVDNEWRVNLLPLMQEM